MSENVLLRALTGVTVNLVDQTAMVNGVTRVTVLIAAVEAADDGAQWL